MIVGVTAVIAVVIALITVVGGDGSDTTAEDPGPATAAADVPGKRDRGERRRSQPESESETSAPAAPVGDVTSLIGGIEVPGTAPASADAQTGEPVTFEAAHLNDDDETTCWRVPGDASGSSVTVTFTEPVQVSEVGMVNGYAKSYPGYDGYLLNRRVLAVDWVFDDGTSVAQQLDTDRSMQSVEVPPTWTEQITIEIAEVSAPGAGPLSKDYTAISELLVQGATELD